MAIDQYKNFAYSTLANSPGTGGTTIDVQTGDGALFPTPPFNATVWPSAVQPLASNAEIVRVTGIASDSFTVTRTQESSNNQDLQSGYQIAATITAKTLTDIEGNYANSFAPYLVQTGSGLQTLANSSAQNSSASMLVFPVTFQAPVKFNQILVANSLSFVTSALTNTMSNSYSSHFGIYSLQSSTLLSLITSNSFSIGETFSQNGATNVTVNWNYPTSTHTSGYAYGTFPNAVDGSAKVSSYISASRVVGLQFNTEMSLSGGQYWIGLMSMRSSAVTSVVGLSHAGIIGQVVNPINMPGSVSGLKPLGIPAADWANNATTNTGWFGRNIMGFLTATTIANFLGTHVPDNISISQLAAVANNSTVTILPAVTFVST